MIRFYVGWFILVVTGAVLLCIAATLLPIGPCIGGGKVEAITECDPDGSCSVLLSDGRYAKIDQPIHGGECH